MPPIELLLSRLKDVKKSGNGWVGRCPIHDDQRPSLHVNLGDNGLILLHCFAGCDTKQIVAAVGLSIPDLFPDTPQRQHQRKESKVKNQPRGKLFRSAEQALGWLESKHGKATATWDYPNAAGELVGQVIRWDTSDGKDFRPTALHPNGWRAVGMPCPRPLFNLPGVLKSSGIVFVTEGEKAAVAVASLGVVATTSAGGSSAARQSDWSVLSGRDIVLLPDNDTAGKKYADTVVPILTRLNPRPTVRVVHLPGLPSKGDAVEWLESHGDAAEPEALREELLALVHATPPLCDPPHAKIAADADSVIPDLVCLADVVPVPVPWLWPSRIAVGRITLLVGRPGAGKSLLSCDIAARLSRGTDWPDGGAAPLGDTLLISAEDDPADTIVPRLIGAGADRRRVHLLRAAKWVEEDGREIVSMFDLSNVELIRKSLDLLPVCRLVVVDPIGSYLGGGVDAHRDNEVRAVLAPLAQLASEKGVAVVLVCHSRKAGADFADDTVLGSRAFTALARSVLHLSDDELDRDRKLLLSGKNNITKLAGGLAYRIVSDPLSLAWEEGVLDDLRADDVLPHAAQRGGSRRGPAPEKRDAAVEWLRRLLRNGALSVAEIAAQAKAAGLYWRTVKRAQEHLGITPEKLTFAGGWVWRLPTSDQEARDDDVL